MSFAISKVGVPPQIPSVPVSGNEAMLSGDQQQQQCHAPGYRVALQQTHQPVHGTDLSFGSPISSGGGRWPFAGSIGQRPVPTNPHRAGSAQQSHRGALAQKKSVGALMELLSPSAARTTLNGACLDDPKDLNGACLDDPKDSSSQRWHEVFAQAVLNPLNGRWVMIG